MASHHRFIHSRSADVEIAPEEWIPFLDTFSRQHQGWLASITVGKASNERTEAGDWHLQGISSDHVGRRAEIYVSVARTDGGHLTHAVQNPTKVVFHRNCEGAPEELEILSVDGMRTRVRFRTTAEASPDGIQQGLQHSDGATRLRAQFSAERAILPRLEARETEVHISLDGITLRANMVLPDQARGIVLFAHGSGSRRQSPRNREVAAALQDSGFGTLLLGLLTSEEESQDEHTSALRFNIDLLARRLIGATWWLADQSQTIRLPIGYFGASTGAAAALVAAAAVFDLVSAIVSRGGRPDLAGDALHKVLAPTLLIVGDRDRQILKLHRSAIELIPAPKKLEVVSGATHLFEEPGTLETMASLATDWFSTHMARAGESRKAA